MVLCCDLVSHFLTEYGIEDAGIKKAGIFYLIFSQKIGIMATAAPKRKSFPGRFRTAFSRTAVACGFQADRYLVL